MKGRKLNVQEKTALYNFIRASNGEFRAMATEFAETGESWRVPVEIVGLTIWIGRMMIRPRYSFVETDGWIAVSMDSDETVVEVEFKEGCDNERFTRELAMIRLATVDYE